MGLNGGVYIRGGLQPGKKESVSKRAIAGHVDQNGPTSGGGEGEFYGMLISS